MIRSTGRYVCFFLAVEFASWEISTFSAQGFLPPPFLHARPPSSTWAQNGDGEGIADNVHGSWIGANSTGVVSALRSMDHIFVFGVGYTGEWFCRTVRHIAEETFNAGTKDLNRPRISASTRCPEKAHLLRTSGLVDDVHIFDIENEYKGLDARGRAALSSSSHVLVTCPPVADFDQDPLITLHLDVLRSSARLRWVGYLSTTGVYGNHDGAWVHEDSDTLCGATIRPSMRLRLAAEQEWLRPSFVKESQPRELARKEHEVQTQMHNAPQLPVHIFRLAGIYGPGRSALDTVRRVMLREESEARSTLASSGGVTDSAMALQWVNRIHVVDICGVLLASIARPSPGTVYNVADNCPASRQEVLTFASKLLLNSTKPTVTEGHITERASRDALDLLIANVLSSSGRADSSTSERRMRTLNKENKRVQNTRLSNELKYSLRFPTYVEGLGQILTHEAYFEVGEH